MKVFSLFVDITNFKNITLGLTLCLKLWSFVSDKIIHEMLP